MQIRKIGQQPTEQFSIVPNLLARDKRLSFRARGIMLLINSHADGYHVNADTLAEDGREGRDAIRRAMNELIECNYLRRVRRQDEAGHWRTDINVYPYGDAPPFTRTEAVEREVVDDDFSPTTDFQSSVNQSSVSQSVLEHQSEDSSEVSVDDGSRTTGGDPFTEVTQTTTVIDDEVSRTRDSRPLPLVYQRLLADRHGIVTPEQQQAWSSAWDSAEQIKGEVPFEPYDHLAIYLTGCSEGRHRASAQRWLRFFIEDRGKHVAALVADAERRALAEETPQEREDRLNRRLPPVIDYGQFCTCGAEVATEPHREGCRRAAAETGEQA